MDYVDVDDRHVEAAQRPYDDLEPDEQAQPFVGLSGKYAKTKSQINSLAMTRRRHAAAPTVT